MNTESGRRLIVSGCVQGVGFRAWVVRQAKKLSLSGYARNLEDGTVEVVAVGSEDSVRTLAAALENGPVLARVDAVRIAGCANVDSGTGFFVR